MSLAIPGRGLTAQAKYVTRLWRSEDRQVDFDRDAVDSGWREALAAYVAGEAKPVEKYGHQPRLYALTQAIGEGLAYDDDVVFAAAWLHDLGVFTGHRPEERELLERWDNVAYAIERTPEILSGAGFPMEKVGAVVECIQHHQPTGDPQTVEGAIVRDADILEQLGAVGILRTVCKVGRDTRFSTFTQAVELLRTAVETLPGMLRLASSRRLAEERVAVHRGFLRAVGSEAGELLY